MSEKQRFRIPTLDGGVMPSISPQLLESDRGYSSSVYNLDFTIPGVPVKRPGTTTFVSPTTENILGCHSFTKLLTDNHYMVVAQNGSLIVWDTLNNQWQTVVSGILSEEFDFLTIADMVLVVSETITLVLNRPQLRVTFGGPYNTMQYNTSSNDIAYRFRIKASLEEKTLPTGKYLEGYRLRAALAGNLEFPSMLFLSHTGDPTLWNPDTLGSNATRVFVAPDDGEGISGLLNMGDGSLLIGKPSSLYMLFGYARENFAIDPLDFSVGVAAHKSMIYSAPYAYFVSRRGIYRIRQGERPEQISLALKEFFDNQVNQDELHQAKGLLLGNLYVITLPRIGGGSITLVYDTIRERWVGEWTAPLMGAVTTRASGEVYYNEPAGRQLYEIKPNSLKDESKGITASLTTIELDADLPEIEKDIGDLYLICRGHTTAYNITVSLQFDGGGWVVRKQDVRIDVPLGAQELIRIPVGKTVRFFRVKIESCAGEANFSPMSLLYTFYQRDVL